jgi:hypothetical protein
MPIQLPGYLKWDGAKYVLVPENDVGGGGSSVTFSGDLSGTLSSQTVTGLQGNDVHTTLPTNGQVLTWDSAQEYWYPSDVSGSGFTASGDLSGDSTSQTVIRINGTSVTSTVPTTGQVLGYDGYSWTPISLPSLYVTPEDFGAIGNGIADDSAAVQSALNSTKPCVLFGTYKIVTPLTLTVVDKEVLGFGGKLTTSANIEILSPSVRCRLVNLHFVGSGASSGLTSQRALSMIAARGSSVEHFFAEDMGGESVKIQTLNPSASLDVGIVFTSPRIYDSYNGFYFTNRGEYVTVSNCDIQRCREGVVIESGNVIFVGGKIIYSTYAGVHLLPGTNDGHGLFDGVLVNHSSFVNFFMEGPINEGYRFINGFTYDGLVYQGAGCKGIHFENWMFDNCTFRFDGMNTNDRFIMNGCKWGALPCAITHPAPNTYNIIVKGGSEYLTGLPSNGPFPADIVSAAAFAFEQAGGLTNARSDVSFDYFTTTSNTQYTAKTITVPVSKAYLVTVCLWGTDNYTGYGGTKRTLHVVKSGKYYRDSVGGVILSGTSTVQDLTPTWGESPSIDLSFVISTNDILIKVTGEATYNAKWMMETSIRQVSV